MQLQRNSFKKRVLGSHKEYRPAMHTNVSSGCVMCTRMFPCIMSDIKEGLQLFFSICTRVFDPRMQLQRNC